MHPRAAALQGPTRPGAARLLRRRVLRPSLAVARRIALQVLRAARPAAGPDEARSARPRTTIVVVNAYNEGGIMRSVVSVLPQLTRDCDVELVSITRDRETPFYALPDDVTLTVLEDRGATGLLSRLPSLLWHDADGAFPSMSASTDVLLVRKLRSIRTGVVMGTRPATNNLIAELAGPQVVTVGQVHSDLGSQNPALVRAVRRHHRKLDGLTVLTADHERDYRVLLGAAGPRIERIPNAVPPSHAPLSRQDRPIVITAARLFPEKGYDVLLDAFPLVVQQHPDWRLRVFGQGPLQRQIAGQVERTGLTSSVSLEGLTDRLDEEMAGASIFVLSSRSEGFPMVLLEAMSRGLAVVSTDCDHGPRDIITHGVDGLLVPVDDPEALAAAVNRLIADDAERRRLASAAVTAVERYSGATVGHLWRDFLTTVAGRDLRSEPEPEPELRLAS